ncbi:MAG: hypothetical protein ACR2FY_08835 [Pirellulaceae bacterium]
MREITNGELVLEQIPNADADWESIEEFALTFDGYRAWGSFDKCAEIANSNQRNTLTEMRTCLFFEQRRWRHFGDEPDDESLASIRELVVGIRLRIANGQLD